MATPFGDAEKAAHKARWGETVNGMSLHVSVQTAMTTYFAGRGEKITSLKKGKLPFTDNGAPPHPGIHRHVPDFWPRQRCSGQDDCILLRGSGLQALCKRTRRHADPTQGEASPTTQALTHTPFQHAHTLPSARMLDADGAARRGRGVRTHPERNVRRLRAFEAGKHRKAAQKHTHALHFHIHSHMGTQL